jgi:hypothetical protein
LAENIAEHKMLQAELHFQFNIISKYSEIADMLDEEKIKKWNKAKNKSYASMKADGNAPNKRPDQTLEANIEKVAFIFGVTKSQIKELLKPTAGGSKSRWLRDMEAASRHQDDIDVYFVAKQYLRLSPSKMLEIGSRNNELSTLVRLLLVSFIHSPIFQSFKQ